MAARHCGMSSRQPLCVRSVAQVSNLCSPPRQNRGATISGVAQPFTLSEAEGPSAVSARVGRGFHPPPSP
jgi:hypothetical protein